MGACTADRDGAARRACTNQLRTKLKSVRSNPRQIALHFYTELLNTLERHKRTTRRAHTRIRARTARCQAVLLVWDSLASASWVKP